MNKKFGFEGTLALLIFTGFSFILEVIACIIAFSDKFDTRINSEFAERMDSVEHKVRILEAGANRYPAPQPQPQVHSGAKSSLIGIKGKYNGTRFEIGDGESVTFGREIQKCNIVRFRKSKKSRRKTGGIFYFVFRVKLKIFPKRIFIENR